MTQRKPDPVFDALLARLPSQGFVRIPDDFLDWILPTLTDAELRILLYVFRRTYGFGKPSDEISLGQFCKGPTSRTGTALDLGTGLSRQAVLSGIDGLERRGLLQVTRSGTGRGKKCVYSMAVPASVKTSIENLKSTPKEMINGMGLFARKRNGQRRFTRKVKADAPKTASTVNAVDPHQTGFSSIESIQYTAAREKTPSPFKKKPLLESDLHNNHPYMEEDRFEVIVRQFEKIVGACLTPEQRAKLRSKNWQAINPCLYTIVYRELAG